MLAVLKAPDPLLKKKSLPIDNVNDNIKKLMEDMLEAMHKENGIGLAASQVGVLKRVIVLDLQSNDEEGTANGLYPLFIANPEFVFKTSECVVADEGCLSLPEQRVEVIRPESITLRFLDYNNNKREINASGWLARAIQHEIDHLDGKLLIDYLSDIKRSIALRKLTKIKKNNL